MSWQASALPKRIIIIGIPKSAALLTTPGSAAYIISD
jgi:hypothetical protein